MSFDMDYTEREINRIREKLSDYYGSATPFFPMATADVVRIERMTENEVIEEAKRLKIIH